MLAACKRFVRDVRELDGVLTGAKLAACSHCGTAGALIGHGLVRGYCSQSSRIVTRGRRLLCSDRHRRSGCGRTISVLIATCIARFVVRTQALSAMLRGVVGGASRRSAWEALGCGLSIRSGYRLWRRLTRAQHELRTLLLRVADPPASSASLPEAQLLAHLDDVFPSADCVLASVQRHFQADLFA